MKPSIGRIVHFWSNIGGDVGVTPDGKVPAIITHVWTDDAVDLTVFRNGMMPIPLNHVGRTGTVEKQNSGWDWPVRE